MLTLLNLLSAVSLLVWGTHIVRTGILRVYGASLRRVLSRSMQRMPLAFLSGIAVTALVQSSNATALLVTSFVAQGLVPLTPALAIMLGADVGTALMARVLTFDLSWLSPLLIFLGVVFFLGRKQTRAGQLGRVAIGLGLIILALQLIVEAASPMTHAAGVKVLFSSLTGDELLDALTGAVFAMVSYSSLAAVLLTATLAGSGVISLKVALCLVVGANLGSGVLALMGAAKQGVEARRVAVGSLLFKLAGCILVLPWIGLVADWLQGYDFNEAEVVIGFHVAYNLVRCLLFLPLTGPLARFCTAILPSRESAETILRPRHLDTAALDTPALALTNASRELLRMGDVIEQMLQHLLVLVSGVGDKQLAREVRRLDDDVDALYTAIKLYLARMPREDLDERDSRRWAETIELAINLEQAGDLIERMASDVESKKIAARRSFSASGVEELTSLHRLLVDSLKLCLSVYLSGDLDAARRLRRLKQRFRLLERRYAHAHVERLHQQVVESFETSSLHLGLLSDMRRVNSLFCSIAHGVLEAADAGYATEHELPVEGREEADGV
ncbi:Na/Pi cotransporter family protein [Pseudomonas oryzihabitans]|uniref:Na/Pi cotransporter family protein n=1 Tax=Pseudomonas oryzihabitans TaxID=47885 RepID=UPI00285A6CCB|nr:Na/Pi cotransporter family protein [Pseudomonas psychrotolerans]MDR6676894.1 phosphate:Na+ symporter [Pseudomonas psychrotolerans]